MEKIWKMLESIEILNLSQQKEEETFWCHTTKFFTKKKLLATEMKKTEILK